MSRFDLVRHVHLIGIGGFGISAIARVLLGQGYNVSGSDMNANDLTVALARDGAVIYEGHAAEYVNNADVVIRSSAVKDDHVEVVAARARDIPVYKRDDIIADLMAGKTVIAVAGTHGKTTTTAMIVHILKACGKDPSYIVGGIMGNTGTNAGVGQGEIFVIEADEYDNMFLGLRPDVIVLTNVEYDHPDFFKSEAELVESFSRFVDSVSIGGTHGYLPTSPDDTGTRAAESRLIVCVDSPAAMQIAREKRTPVVTYGFADDADGCIKNLHVDEAGCAVFELIGSDSGAGPHPVRLNLHGRHNAQNASGALLAAQHVGVTLEAALNALAMFQSTGRRFEVCGKVGGVIVVDDYAHHPTAINVTLEAAKMRYPDHRIYAVWQPHTFSRTQTLLDQFATAFTYADVVLVTDIYKSREQQTPDSITGAQAAAAICHDAVHYTGSLTSTTDFLLENVRTPAVIVVMSAGDAPQISAAFLENYPTG